MHILWQKSIKSVLSDERDQNKSTPTTTTTMEINETTSSIFYTIRLFGFAPYSLERNESKHIVGVRLSRSKCTYSILLVIILCITTNYGLYYDGKSDYPLR